MTWSHTNTARAGSKQWLHLDNYFQASFKRHFQDTEYTHWYLCMWWIAAGFSFDPWSYAEGGVTLNVTAIWMFCICCSANVLVIIWACHTHAHSIGTRLVYEEQHVLIRLCRNRRSHSIKSRCVSLSVLIREVMTVTCFRLSCLKINILLLNTQNAYTPKEP